MTEFQNEAEGYAASLRQQANWMRELPQYFANYLDPDELDAAAEFIERQQLEIARLELFLRSS